MNNEYCIYCRYYRKYAYGTGHINRCINSKLDVCADASFPVEIDLSLLAKCKLLNHRRLMWGYRLSKERN